MNNIKEDNKLYYIYYTGLFFLLIGICYMWFFINNKSLIFWDVANSGAGLFKHVKTHAYYGEYLRNVLKTIFIDNSLNIPLWDMSIGYGADIVTSLNYYVMGDPLTLLSVFCPKEYTEYLYNFLILLRIYFTGIAFSFYCKYFKRDSYATLIGAIIYSFCGSVLFIVHPFFNNPMIYLPLLLIGVEKIFEKKSPLLFILMVAVCAISNFYFFYMIGVLTLIYTIFRYCMLGLPMKIYNIAKWIEYFLFVGIIGIMIAGVLFLPTIMAIISNDRFGVENYIPILYDLRFYLQLPSAFIIGNADKHTFIGLTVVGAFALLTLFGKRHDNTALKLGIILLTFFLSVPFCGHILNGFSYPSNRWIFGFNFLMTYVIVKMIPEFLVMSRRRRTIVTLACFTYALLAYIVQIRVNVQTISSYDLLRIGIIGFFYIIGTILILQFDKKIITKRMKNSILLVIAVGSIGMNAYYLFSPNYINRTQNCVPAGTAWGELTESPSSVLKDLKDNTFFRYDTANIPKGKLMRNAAMQLNLNGTSYYLSTTNGGLGEYFKDLYYNTPQESEYLNLGSRAYMAALASVKYFIIPTGSENYLPYGYDLLVKEEKDYSVYATDEALPLIYAYDTYITPESYSALSTTQKQQAVLEGVVLEQSTLPQTELSFTDERIDYKIELSEGVEIDNNTIIVAEQGATMTIQCSGMQNSETYVIFDNLDYIGLMNSVIKEQNTNAIIGITSGEVNSDVHIINNRHYFYGGRHNLLSSLGYRKEGVDSITLTFSNSGIYTYDSLNIVCQPMDTFTKNCGELREGIEWSRLDYKDNSVDACVTLESKKFVCFSIPYSKGWNAYVDGVKVPLMKANKAYMGIELGAGVHDINLKYRTPYLRLGMILSCMGIVLAVVVVRKYKVNIL